MSLKAAEEEILALTQILENLEGKYLSAEQENLSQKIRDELKGERNIVNIASYIEHAEVVFIGAEMNEIISEKVATKYTVQSQKILAKVVADKSFQEAIASASRTGFKPRWDIADIEKKANAKPEPKQKPKRKAAPKPKAEKPVTVKPKPSTAKKKSTTPSRPTPKFSKVKPSEDKTSAQTEPPAKREKPPIMTRGAGKLFPDYAKSGVTDDTPRTKLPMELPQETKSFSEKWPQFDKLTKDLKLKDFSEFETKVMGAKQAIGIDKIAKSCKGDYRMFLGNLQTNIKQYAEQQKIDLPDSPLMIAVGLSRELNNFSKSIQR